MIINKHSHDLRFGDLSFLRGKDGGPVLDGCATLIFFKCVEREAGGEVAGDEDFMRLLGSFGGEECDALLEDGLSSASLSLSGTLSSINNPRTCFSFFPSCVGGGLSALARLKEIRELGDLVPCRLDVVVTRRFDGGAEGSGGAESSPGTDGVGFFGVAS